MAILPLLALLSSSFSELGLDPFRSKFAASKLLLEFVLRITTLHRHESTCIVLD